MGRTLEAVRDKDTGSGRTPQSIFIRKRIADKVVKDKEELQWLAKGIQSEVEKIQKGTIGEYLELLKYTITHQEKHG